MTRFVPEAMGVYPRRGIIIKPSQMNFLETDAPWDRPTFIMGASVTDETMDEVFVTILTWLRSFSVTEWLGAGLLVGLGLLPTSELSAGALRLNRLEI
jgi:hypothetical protein